jgi:hypothetical protein
MNTTDKKIAPPDAGGAMDQSSLENTTTRRADEQAAQPAAFWREVTPNKCADCGKLLGDDWTGCDNDRMSDRGRLWCAPCTMRRELAL